MAIHFLKKDKFIAITSIVLIAWIFIALVRTGLNLSKVFSEEIEWINLTRTQKQEYLFGDLHTFFSAIDKKTSKRSRILLFSTDGKAYFYGRYYLYPKEIYWVKNRADLNRELHLRKYDYLALYKFEKDIKRQLVNNEIVNLVTISTLKFGELYKIK